MVKVTYTNGTDSLTLQFVRNISWSTTVNSDVIISTSDQQSKLTRQVTINGFINKSMWVDNVQAQQQLETDLQAVAVGSIKYDGLTDIEDARFTSLSFNEFRGDPLTEFTITFETETANIHAHAPISIGSLALTVANGFTDIEVEDSLSTQGKDEALSKLLKRKFTLSGKIIGSSLSEVNGNADRIQSELDGNSETTLSLSSTSGGTVYTTRVRSIDISSPGVRDQSTPRRFSVSLETHDDYAKEPYTLGEVQQTFGTITWDKVDSVEKDISFNTTTNNRQSINSESFVVQGLQYFDGFTSFDTERLTWNNPTTLPPHISTPGAYSITSQSGATLTLRSLSFGDLNRAGNFPVTNAKRYSSSVTGTWEFVEGDEQKSIDSSETYLGILFNTVDSFSTTVQLNGQGIETRRSASVSGVIEVPVSGKQLAVDSLLDKRGTSQLLRLGLTDDTSYFISSVNIQSIDTAFRGGAEVALIKVSVAANKLDTAQQAKFFIGLTFNLNNLSSNGGATSPFIDNITSLSKSFSYTSFAGEERISTISISCSGETWASEVAAAGAPSQGPQNPTRNIELLNKLDSTLRANFPTASSGSQGTSAVPDTGNVIPNAQPGESWTLNSISVGPWEAFVKPVNNPNGLRFWKQTISLNIKVAYDVTGISGGSQSQPVFVDTESVSITEPTPKFVQIQVAGFGTVFKRIGTNPAKAVATRERKYSNMRVFDASHTPSDPSQPTVPGGGTFTILKKQTDRRNLTVRRTLEFIQID